MSEYDVVDSLPELLAQWRAMYDDRRAEANRLWDVLHQLAGDQRIPLNVRGEILKELAK